MHRAPCADAHLFSRAKREPRVFRRCRAQRTPRVAAWEVDAAAMQAGMCVILQGDFSKEEAWSALNSNERENGALSYEKCTRSMP